MGIEEDEILVALICLIVRVLFIHDTVHDSTIDCRKYEFIVQCRIKETDCIWICMHIFQL